MAEGGPSSHPHMQNSRAARTLDTMEGHRAEALDEAFQESLRLTAPCNSPLIAEPQQPASGPPGVVASDSLDRKTSANPRLPRSSLPVPRPPLPPQCEITEMQTNDPLRQKTKVPHPHDVIVHT